jgi:hypothetical protein
MCPHIVKAYDEELRRLKERVVTLTAAANERIGSGSD